mmetsp:Transcript_17963/g.41118  ORF Transcript_17963/g.41118 Transcript_17963/m.41118 type:complete len:225 (+) Transcript_17963:213-887(+)
MDLGGNALSLLLGTRDLVHHRLEEHVASVSVEEVLDPKAHDGNHGEAAVGELFLLVVEPPGVGVVDELRGAEEVAGRVGRVLLDLDAQELEEADEHEDLEGARRRELLERLDGVLRVRDVAVLGERVEGRRDEPVEARSHGLAAVLELSLAVRGHLLEGLALGEAERVEVANRGDVAHQAIDSGGRNLPRLKRGSLLERRSAGAESEEDGSDLHFNWNVKDARS